MLPPSTRFFTRVSTQFNHANTHKNFTWISAIRSPYMQPPPTRFFTRVSTQFSHANTHKNFTWISAIRSPYMQPPSTHFFTSCCHFSILPPKCNNKIRKRFMINTSNQLNVFLSSILQYSCVSLSDSPPFH